VNSLYIALNMLRRTLLQKRGLLLHLVLPAAAISAIIGILGHGGDKAVTIAYLNQDQGLFGAFAAAELAAMPAYQLEQAENELGLKEAVITKKAAAALLVPPGFSERLLRGEAAQAELLQLSPSEASVTLRVNVDGLVKRFGELAALGQQRGLEGAALQDAVQAALQQVSKHQVRAELTDYRLSAGLADNAITGFMLIFIMGLVGSTVGIILEDRRLTTMARMYTAPVRSLEIAVGNFLGSFLIGTLQVLFVLAVTRWVAGYDYKLPFLSQLVMLELFLLASMGVAAAIAGLVKSQTNVGVLNTLVVVPTCMLGGCFWPLSLMPPWMQTLANFVPQKWAIDGIQRLAAGESLAAVGLNMVVLLLFALILLGIGSAVLRPAAADAG